MTDRNKLAGDEFDTRDVLARMLADGLLYGPNRFALPQDEPRHEVRNISGPVLPIDTPPLKRNFGMDPPGQGRPTAALQERIAEGISPVAGNVFTPLREAYQAGQRGDLAGVLEHGGPVALGMALPIPGAKGRPGTLVNALSEQGKPTMSHLAMDEASRMARAKEQGFDPGWYHGTGADKFDEFRRNTFITNIPEEASRYADSAARQDGGHPSVLPLHSRGERYATQADFDAAEAALNKSSKGGYVSSRNVFDELERLGFDGFTEADASGRAMRVVFDPKNLRSRFAAFDPAHAGSGKIMAGLAAPAIMGPALVNALSGESSND